MDTVGVRALKIQLDEYVHRVRAGDLKPPMVRSGTEDVCLTFDDGPTPGVTCRILDILRRHQASATFFVCGVSARRHGDLVQRAAREGHEIGNHTWDHPRLRGLDETAITAQLTKTNEVITALTGRQVRLFRPPYGRYDRQTLRVARALGLRTILWSITPKDWLCPGSDAIAERVGKELAPGAIVLLHDGCDEALASTTGPKCGASREQTVLALPRILSAIQARGLRTASFRR